MKTGLLGLFSGFPARRFTEEIAARLKAELPLRDSLVFVSAWPSEHERNDDDAAGMHGMFESCGMPFRRFCVIDDRTEAEEAKRLIREASCIFLMGGNATLQMELIRRKDVRDELRMSNAVILGVSAGSSNMASRALDIWESDEPYEGLGLTEITVKAHMTQADTQLQQTLMQISENHDLPICAMEDESAIFIKDGCITQTGKQYWICHGKMQLFSPELHCR